MLHPGGCDIGARPIDIHIYALQCLGVDINDNYCNATKQDESFHQINSCGANAFMTNKFDKSNVSYSDSNYVKGNGSKNDGDRPLLNRTAFLKASLSKRNNNSTSVTLPYPSVGATENILLCFAQSGQSIQINNAAREPEIIALQDYLNKTGAKISGAGSSRITIAPSFSGTDPIKSSERNNIVLHFTVPYDRIECGTFLIATAICGGNVVIKGFNFSEQKYLLKILKPKQTYISDHTIIVNAEPHLPMSDIVVTAPYPGLPTDLQSPLSAFFCTVNGKNYIIESVFKNRTSHLEELKKLGGKITKIKNYFIIEGSNKLLGCSVTSKDLRGGAALILAGLKADGVTEVLDSAFISRGYDRIEHKLSQLGAKIKKQI